jgi:hypothetical protein
MAETKKGRLGVAELAADTLTAVYTVTTAMDSECTIFLSNISKSNVKYRIAIVDGLAANIADEDYVRYSGTLSPGESIEPITVVMDAAESVCVWGDIAGLVCRCDGTEEDEVSSSDGYPLVRKITSQSLAFGDFTDNTDTTGYIDITTAQLPAGAIPLGWKAIVSTGFTGDTTAVISVGGTSDLDRFSEAVDQSVLAAGTVGGTPPIDGGDGMAAAQTIRVTVTGGADFGAITAGVMVVEVYYLATE